MHILEQAAALALKAHAEQTRKEGDTPYMVHPIAVALILARHGFADDILAAALVHDVVEDTPVTAADIEQTLGEKIASLVVPITHDDSLSWEEKKRAYIESVRAASPEVKAIATADKIANAYSLIANHEQHGTDVWKHFNAGREKKLWFEAAMLEMLTETWQHPLVDEYEALVARLHSLD